MTTDTASGTGAPSREARLAARAWLDGTAGPGTPLPAAVGLDGAKKLGMLTEGMTSPGTWDGPLPGPFADRLARVARWRELLGGRISELEQAAGSGTLDQLLPRAAADRRRDRAPVNEAVEALSAVAGTLRTVRDMYEAAAGQLCGLASLSQQRQHPGGAAGNAARMLLEQWDGELASLLEDAAAERVAALDQRVLELGDLGWFVVHGVPGDAL